jgi:hypothetical protein
MRDKETGDETVWVFKLGSHQMLWPLSECQIRKASNPSAEVG